MKRIALGLLFLLPAVSFAAPLTDVQRASIIQELAVLEAELQALEAQVGTSTPMVGAVATSTEATSTPFNQICDGHITPMGAPLCKWSISHELGPA